MRDVAIIGAGDLGGTLAHVLARREVAAAIRLIDESGHVAAGKALDIMQAGPIERFATRVSGSSDMAAAVGAAVIVIADPAGRGEWSVEEGLLLVNRLMYAVSRSVIVCASAASRELVERGVRELHVPRERLFGSAPEALVSALRAVVAVEANGSPRDVALTVLGVPPAHVVVPWEEATIAGFSVVRMLDEPVRRRISGRVGPLWPPGPYALASAFVAPDDRQGRRTRAAAMPVSLGPGGIERIVLPSLTVHDQVALDNAIML